MIVVSSPKGNPVKLTARLAQPDIEQAVLEYVCDRLDISPYRIQDKDYTYNDGVCTVTYKLKGAS